MARRPDGLSKRQITKHLEALGDQVIEVDAAGEPVRRYDKLAAMLWDRALGYKETKMDDDGNITEEVHAPQRWAMELVIDRIEGKVVMRTEEALSQKANIAERASKALASRINEITDK